LYVQRTYHPSFGFTEPKSERGKRAVQISPQLFGMLQAHRGASPYNQAADLVFPNVNGKPMDYHNLVSRVFHRTLDGAGLRRVRFHDLRHTYAALMISLGCNIKWLQKQMGHASLSTTMDTYGHIMPDVEEKLGGKLDSLLFDKKIVPLKKKGEKAGTPLLFTVKPLHVGGLSLYL
jgi:integrase